MGLLRDLDRRRRRFQDQVVEDAEGIFKDPGGTLVDISKRGLKEVERSTVDSFNLLSGGLFEELFDKKEDKGPGAAPELPDRDEVFTNLLQERLNKVLRKRGQQTGVSGPGGAGDAAPVFSSTLFSV